MTGYDSSDSKSAETIAMIALALFSTSYNLPVYLLYNGTFRRVYVRMVRCQSNAACVTGSPSNVGTVTVGVNPRHRAAEDNKQSTSRQQTSARKPQPDQQWNQQSRSGTYFQQGCIFGVKDRVPRRNWMTLINEMKEELYGADYNAVGGIKTLSHYTLCVVQTMNSLVKIWQKQPWLLKIILYKWIREFLLSALISKTRRAESPLSHRQRQVKMFGWAKFGGDDLGAVGARIEVQRSFTLTTLTSCIIHCRQGVGGTVWKMA